MQLVNKHLYITYKFCSQDTYKLMGVIDKGVEKFKLTVPYNILCTQRREPSPPPGLVEHDFID